MESLTKVLKEYLFEILIKGHDTVKDDNDNIKEHLCNHYLIRAPAKDSRELLSDIKDGVYDLEYYPLKGEALFDYVSSLDNHGLDGFVYTYPNRIFEQKSTPSSNEFINQFQIILNRLNNNSGSNRAVATIYNPFHDCYEKDIPCLQWIQCTIRNNQLILHCIFRSNDIFGAFYSNMLFLTYLGLRLTEEYNSYDLNDDVEFQGIDYHSTSGHIYEYNVDEAVKLYKSL